MPAGRPMATTLPNRPRRPCGACSTDISTAPPHSPPSAKPWTKRHVDQQRGRPGANLGVGGEQSDAERRQAHQHQRPHEHELAPEPIPEVAHHHAAERTRDEPDGERREGSERACQLRDLREELRTEDDGSRRPVNEEVVPLDGRADGARDRDTPGL